MLLYVELERQICASEPNECDPGAVNTVVEQLQRNVCRFCSLRRVCISWRCIQPRRLTSIIVRVQTSTRAIWLLAYTYCISRRNFRG